MTNVSQSGDPAVAPGGKCCRSWREAAFTQQLSRHRVAASPAARQKGRRFLSRHPERPVVGSFPSYKPHFPLEIIVVVGIKPYHFLICEAWNHFHTQLGMRPVHVALGWSEICLGSCCSRLAARTSKHVAAECMTGHKVSFISSKMPASHTSRGRGRAHEPTQSLRF